MAFPNNTCLHPPPHPLHSTACVPRYTHLFPLSIVKHFHYPEGWTRQATPPMHCTHLHTYALYTCTHMRKTPTSHTHTTWTHRGLTPEIFVLFVLWKTTLVERTLFNVSLVCPQCGVCVVSVCVCVCVFAHTYAVTTQEDTKDVSPCPWHHNIMLMRLQYSAWQWHCIPDVKYKNKMATTC